MGNQTTKTTNRHFLRYIPHQYLLTKMKDFLREASKTAKLVILSLPLGDHIGNCQLLNAYHSDYDLEQVAFCKLD